MGAHIVFAQQAVALERRGDDRVVRLLDGTELRARAVVIATGIEWRRLGVPVLEALVGSGVFYGAAASESRAMQGQDVFIVGAGNSAGQAALHLAKYARSVTLLVRGDSFAELDVELPRARHRVDSERRSFAIRTRSSTAAATDRLEHSRLPIAPTTPSRRFRDRAVRHDRRRTAHPVASRRDRARRAGLPRHGPRPRAPTHGTGRDPCARDEHAGVFAARAGPIKRVASAVGEGATVVRMVHEYLGSLPLRSSRASPVRVAR